jgi:hypothetical protein
MIDRKHYILLTIMTTHTGIKWLADDECAAWCRDKGINLNDNIPVPPWQSEKFALPTDVGERTGMCRGLWLLVSMPLTSSIVLWSQDHHVFTTAEHPALLNTWMTEDAWHVGRACHNRPWAVFFVAERLLIVGLLGV